MTTQEIINKLKELGIDSTNVYPKKSFLRNGEPVVGLYKYEFKEDFYFFIEYTKTMYVLRKVADHTQFEEDEYEGKPKWLVPLDICEVLWVDRGEIPLEDLELPDEKFMNMTLRQYACIHLKVPNSGTPWLDTLIKESQRNVNHVNTTSAQW